MLPNYYVTTLRTALQKGGAETQIDINSIQTPDGVTIAIADFDLLGGEVHLTIDPQSAQKVEYVKATGITGVGPSFTSATRGLGFNSVSSVTANKKYHPVGATVLISWGTHDVVSFVDRYTAQAVGGVKTFSSSPIVPTPTTASQAATKGYVDGVAIAGAPDASTSTKGIGRVSVAPVSPTTPIFVGDNDGRVPTQAENDALVGNNTAIAVGTGNKFITQTGLQASSETYAATSTGNDTYVATFSPALQAYTTGMIARIKVDVANAGGATININGLGAKTITRIDGSALTDGNMCPGMVAILVYDGTNFQLVNPVYYQVFVFTATGTWICPRGVTSVLVDIVAGGGGGGGQNNNTGAGGGGGGGAGAINVVQSVTPYTEYTVTVGTGGAGGNTAPNAGAPGTNSSFAGITKTGGSGGSAASGTTGGGGGAAGDASAGNGGAGGSSAGAGSAGSAGTGGGSGGAGGAGTGGSWAGGGGGGASGVGTSGAAGPVGGAGVSGNSAVRGGGGGSGGSNQGSGGTGGNGFVIIKVPLTQIT